MPRSVQVLVVAVVLAVIGFTFNKAFRAGPGTAGPGGGGPPMLAGAPAQSFDLKTLDGATGSLGQYRGRVVLANLWATWCAPCRSETPALEQLFRSEGARGLVVVGIDQGESASAAGAFAKQMALTYPILLDEDQQYGRAYAAIGLPTSIVVDRAGHIVRGIDGALSLAQMRAAVDPLLAAR